MIRVGLGRGPGSYAGLEAPWDPGHAWPELRDRMPCATGAAQGDVYGAVRASLVGLGLDSANLDRPEWNPLRDLVHAGGHVVLKPNFIRHWNPLAEADAGASVESVITHGAVLRAAIDYAFLAVGPGGRVTLAEAPQQDCDWDRIVEIVGLDAIQERVREVWGRELEVIDLRREAVRFEAGVIVERRALPGDPLGYRAVDLGHRSFFTDAGLDPGRLRGADYDPGPTSEHHSGGRNAYLLSETVLCSDLIVNLPKLKTHKKTGVTLALKNMVGINGDKNWLPHHCSGSVGDGGDEFPGGRLLDRARSQLADLGRQLLKRGIGTRIAQAYRRVETATRGDDFIRSGNWHGNRTTWRMCADLNRCVYYSDAAGEHFDAAAPVRPVLTILDGIVSGEGNGPLAPRDVSLGVVIAGTDPLAVDLVAIRAMGFDERRIPKILEPMQSDDLRISDVRCAEDVQVGEVEESAGGERPASAVRLYDLNAIAALHSFEPHPGWLNHIERGADDAVNDSRQRASA
ncbi:MAG: DUF362 domain-containing protein [Deltaproteobacteria bacterium]|nr:DUF362 domain-containing protein [Deltaproteobacteria bacterium]MBW2695545.1 DUF362 domain-containing protein [Deltaproteobacteria bacterium]